MKIHDPVKAVAALATILLLASCDPDTCGTASVINKSSDTIEVLRNGNSSAVLAPEGALNIGPVCGVGMGTEVGQLITELDKVQRGAVWCKRDIRKEQNWTTTKSSKTQFDHRFVVTDSDF